MPLHVYVHVVQIETLPMQRFKLWADVLPIPVPISSEISYDDRSNTHYAKEPIKLAAGTRYSSILRLCIRPYDSWSKTIAYVSLPLHWFPADQTVSDWFPFQSNLSSARGVFARVRVHIVKRWDLAPFTAPPGPLLVLPAWNRPARPSAPPVPFANPIPPGYRRLTVHQGPYPGGSCLPSAVLPGFMPPQIDREPNASADPPPSTDALGRQSNPENASAIHGDPTQPLYPPPPAAAFPDDASAGAADFPDYPSLVDEPWTVEIADAM
jgi:hypothetical protein